MSYTIQFVGLVCFLRDNGSRKVLLPDGRDPGDGIDPHIASIVVASDAIIGDPEWPVTEPGTFTLDRSCRVTISGTSSPGTLDTSAHDGRLPELRRIDQSFAINPETAQTIAQLDIRQGTLRAFRIPGGDATMSQLDVPYEEEIVIDVHFDDADTRSLRLRPGTEIAITNTATHGYKMRTEENGHFRIYEKLSTQPTHLIEPSDVPAVPPSPTRHIYFARANPIGLSTSCSNTGCCPLSPGP